MISLRFPAAALLAAVVAWSSHAAPPTIVVFLSDDHSQLDSTPYGTKDIRTPNKQRRSDAGMTFTRAFVASPSSKYIRNLHPEFQHASHINRAKDRDGLMFWISWEAKAKGDPAAAMAVQRFKQRPAEELYDLRNDPFELNNLAGDPRQAERVAAMRLDVDAWMKAQGDQQADFNKPLMFGEEATPMAGGTAPKKEI